MPKVRNHPVDLAVGRALRARRLLLGITQEALAGHLGVSFQQVQKYEKGANRISASVLAETARLFGCRVGDFFQEPVDDTPDSAAMTIETAIVNGATPLLETWLALPAIGRTAILHSARAMADVTAAAAQAAAERPAA